jgi:hypothetical protein
MPGQTFSVVLLAGSLRPSELQARLGVPPVCLPIASGRTLLGLWCERLAALPEFRGGAVAVSGKGEAFIVRRSAPAGCLIEVVTDPRPWRGMAGLVGDLWPSLPDADIVVAAEAGTLPPDEIRSLLAPLEAGEAEVVIGADRSGEASGAFALRTRLLERIRNVGYRDLKEQFLPELHRLGVPMRSAVTGARVIRIRRLEGYLEAIEHVRSVEGANADATAPVPDSSAGRRWARSLVHPGASVSENAVLADAVVMDGASVHGGAVVSRSVVGPGGVVPAEARVIGRILGLSGETTGRLPADEA